MILNRVWSVLFSLCLAFSYNAEAQQKARTNQVDKGMRTIITGFVNELPSEDMKVTLEQWNAHDFINRSTSYSCMTKEGNWFRFELDLNAPKLITVAVDEYTLFRHFDGYGILIEPGDSICIDLQTKKPASILDVVFAGRGCKKLIALQEMAKRLSSLPRCEKPWLDPLDKKIANSKFHLFEKLEVIEQYKGSLSIRGYNILRSRAFIASLNDIMMYLLNEKITTEEMEKFYQEILPVFPLSDLFNTDNIVSDSEWRRALHNNALINYAITNNLSYGSVDKQNVVTFYDILLQTYSRYSGKEWVLSNHIIGYASTNGWNDELELVARKFYMDVPANSMYLKQVKAIENKFKSEAKSPLAAFDFALPDSTGRIVRLGDFSGKIVLIEFMQTGCAGCHAMAPKITEIENEFRGQENFVTISISIDKSEALFKKGIGKFTSQSSLTLFTNGEGYNHPIIKYYGIQSFPSLVLIDKDGKVSALRAPDPRSEDGKKNLINLIQKSLDKEK